MKKKIENGKVSVEQLAVGSYKNFSYVITDVKSREAAVVDPAWDLEAIKRKLDEGGFKLVFIINTHAHFDHVEGNEKLAAITGAKVIMHESSLLKKDKGVGDGDSIKIGDALVLRFIHTPGHSPESMCLIVNDLALITGDTLFIGECGRVDLPGGDPSALYDSFKKLRELDGNLLVLPGHDYGPKASASLSEEIATNYTLAERSREEFVHFMNSP